MRGGDCIGVREPVPYERLVVGVPKETYANECRVALTPQGVAALLKAGFCAVHVERGAGAAAQFTVRAALLPPGTAPCALLHRRP